jgi:hypothetical protein
LTPLSQHQKGTSPDGIGWNNLVWGFPIQYVSDSPDDKTTLNKISINTDDIKVDGLIINMMFYFAFYSLLIAYIQKEYIKKERKNFFKWLFNLKHLAWLILCINVIALVCLDLFGDYAFSSRSMSSYERTSIYMTFVLANLIALIPLSIYWLFVKFGGRSQFKNKV